MCWPSVCMYERMSECADEGPRLPLSPAPRSLSAPWYYLLPDIFCSCKTFLRGKVTVARDRVLAQSWCP